MSLTDIDELIAQLNVHRANGVKEVWLGVGLNARTIDEIVVLKKTPAIILCNNDWMKSKSN